MSLLEILDYLIRNKEWIFSGIGVLAISAVFWAVVNTRPRMPASESLAEPEEHGVVSQRGSFTIPLELGRTHEVFYPRQFAAPPFLTVACVDGRVDFEIAEQRRDGFKFRTGRSGYGGSEGIRVQWEAKGEFPPGAA